MVGVEMIAISRIAPGFLRHDVLSLFARSRAFLGRASLRKPNWEEYLHFALLPQGGSRSLHNVRNRLPAQAGARLRDFAAGRTQPLRILLSR